MEQKIIYILHSGSTVVRESAARQLTLLDALMQEKDGSRVLVLGAEDLAELPAVFNLRALPRVEPADYLIPIGEIKRQAAPSWPSRKQLRQPDPHKCSPAQANKKGYFRRNPAY